MVWLVKETFSKFDLALSFSIIRCIEIWVRCFLQVFCLYSLHLLHDVVLRPAESQ